MLECSVASEVEASNLCILPFPFNGRRLSQVDSPQLLLKMRCDGLVQPAVVGWLKLTLMNKESKLVYSIRKQDARRLEKGQGS